MPEGDTVWRAARRLDQTLSGQVLTGSDFRVPQHATADLVGATVTRTVARGKHLLTRVVPLDGPGLTLHTHLKMEGVWHVHPSGSRWRRPAHEARVVLTTDGWEAVGFALGVVALIPTADEDHAVGHLGPDLLGPDWDEEEALRRLTVDTARTIGEALLDQSNLAGIGTVYRSEVCFVLGVHPRTPVAKIGDLPRLVRRARAMLELNKSRAERTTTGNTRGGRLWVYGRRGPCARCGTRVLREEFGPLGRERLAYWCPTCQPLTAP